MWIKVTERLPESGQQVIMFHIEYGIGIGYCIPFNGSFAGTFNNVPVIDEDNKVTHWQEITPPKD